MNDIIDYRIPWGQFIYTFLVCGLIIVAYFYIIKPLFKRVTLSISDREANSFQLAERVGVVILLIIVLISFLLVNPILHGFLLLLLIFLTKDIVINVIFGALLIREFNLVEGMKLNVKEYDGILYKLGWTGIHLSSVKNIDFISYQYLYKNGISKSQEFVPSLARIKCSHKNINDERQLITKLKGKLITYPFLLESSTPEFIMGEGYIEMVVGLISTKHINSLIDSLHKTGFNVEILENT